MGEAGLNWPYINNTPIYYWNGHQPLPQSAPQIAISNPWAAKDLTWLEREPERTVIFLEAHHIGQDLGHLLKQNFELVFIFTELPRDFQLLQLQALIVLHPLIRIALPTHHNSSVESLLLGAPHQILDRICFYSVQTSPTSTEYYLFRNFIQFELPEIVRILNSRGVAYKFFSLPKRYRDPREWMSEADVNPENQTVTESGVSLTTTEAREIFSLLKEGQEPTQLHINRRNKLNADLLNELTTLELIFHKIIVPTSALPKEHAWWELGLQDAFVERKSARPEPSGVALSLTSQLKIIIFMTLKLGAFARWKVSAVTVHSWWLIVAPSQRLWGKIWWRPKAMAVRAAAALVAFWGTIWWRPKAFAIRVSSTLSSLWGKIGWRISVLFQRVYGRCCRIWGNYWWRPVARVKGLWNSWLTLWRRPAAWAQHLFLRTKVVWGRIYWLPKVAMHRLIGSTWGQVGWRAAVAARRSLGALQKAWGHLWWRPLVVLQRVPGRIRLVWGQVWWRPLVFARMMPGRILWVWGQVWWRPIVVTRSIRGQLYSSLIRTYWSFIRTLHALRRPLRIATFPVRKIYYMARYQYKKRILGTWNDNEI